jgi:hypothetical protein
MAAGSGLAGLGVHVVLPGGGAGMPLLQVDGLTRIGIAVKSVVTRAYSAEDDRRFRANVTSHCG